tara:strand:+ start:95 stop:286 length:192 start_codon:yes stop_codon:yes gene_type:complete
MEHPIHGLVKRVDAIAADYDAGRIDWFEHRMLQERVCDDAEDMDMLPHLLGCRWDQLWQTRRR